MYVVIMAGGSGTRLWPKSRAAKPKQFHNLTSSRSMLRETVGRLESSVQPDDIYVIAGKTHMSPILEQLKNIPKSNLIAEPVGRDTAPAVAVAAAILYKRDPDGVVLVTPADHYIAEEEEFLRIVNVAAEVAAKDDAAVTIGIKPTYPETGYGYIEMDGEYSNGHSEVFWVNSFKEKPDPVTAEKYVSSWRYLWNSGMFVWAVKTVLDLFEKHAPDIYEGARKIADAFGTEHEQKVLDEIYPTFRRISVDYAILEKAEKVLVVPGDFGWSDIGSWAALLEVLSDEQTPNVVIGKHAGIDTYGCLIHGGDRLIATVGLDNMIIVDSDDVLLICPKGRAQDVKRLIEKIEEEGLVEYL